MVKTRGYKLIIFSFLIILSISCFSVLFINVWPLTKTEEKDVSSADLYVPGGNFYNEYISTTTFEVYSVSYYKSLVTASNYKVTNATIDGMVYFTYPYSFSGKTISLQVDLSFVGEQAANVILSQNSSNPFKGTFNGNGYTITFPSLIATTSDITGSFCQYNSGTIKNTKFKDAVIQVEDGTQSYTGVIAYTNSGTITNCIVENCKFISNRFKSNCHVSPIAGINNGVINHCMINGTYQIGGNDGNLLLEDDGLYAYYFVSSGDSALNCIFTATVSKVTNSNNDGGECKTPSETDTNTSRNFTSCSSAYNGALLYSSTDCGPSNDISKSWFKYKSTDYGYGGDSKYCVYLRLFVDWTTLEFTVNSTDAGYIVDADFEETTASIVVPSDYDSVSGSSAYLTLTIDYTAEERWALNKSGYSLKNWTSSGSSGGTKVYTAIFEGAMCELYFSDDADESDKTICVDYNVEFGSKNSYFVVYGTELTVTYDKASKPPETIVDDYYYESYTITYLNAITYSFKDADGVDRTVTYKPINSQYVIGVYDSDRYKEGVNKITHGTNTIVRISHFASLKTYNVTFG